MIQINEKATIASISELRNKSEEILKSLKDDPVILERHRKPVAVMLEYQKYLKMQKLLELAEDFILVQKAHERDKNSTEKDFIDIDKW